MSPLVSAEWLADRLAERDVVVLDATLPPVGVSPVVDVHTRYLEGHIPGAVFFDLEEFSDRSSSLPHMLPAAEEFGARISALGVGDFTTVVVYEQEGVFSAPRVWWMLRTFGARNARILDGGLRAWLDGGFALEQGEVFREAASFTAVLDRSAVRDFEEINELTGGRGQIVDARSAGRFSGSAPEPRAGLPSGHMPGAINVPFADLAVNGRLKSAEELQEIFLSKRLDMERPITTTCGSGVTAAVVLLGLEVAGAKDVRLYDGSWTEYAQKEGVAIAKDSVGSGE